MFPMGELTYEMGSRYLNEVDGCPGYFHLLPSFTGDYLYLYNRIFTEEWINYLSVFTDTSNYIHIRTYIDYSEF